MKKTLKKYYDKYGTFTVARQDGSSDGRRWFVYFKYPHDPQLRYLIEHCELTDRFIFPDEIVIETDMNMMKMNRGESDRVCKILRMYGISYKQYWSGNKSYHIHIFFPELSAVYNYRRRRLLKELFIEWLYDDHALYDVMPLYTSMETINYCREVIRDLLARKKVDMQLTGKHLIRLEQSFHPATQAKKRLVSIHATDDINKIPIPVWKIYHIIINKTQLRSWGDTNKNVAEKPCIQFMLSNIFDEGRRRMAFVLFTHMRDKHGADKAAKILLEWNHHMQGGHIPDGELQGIIKYHYDRKEKPGCKYVREILMDIGRLDVCEGCKYNKR